MPWSRALPGDRPFRGGLATLLVYALLLQGLFAEVGQGLAAAAGDTAGCPSAGSQGPARCNLKSRPSTE